MCLHAYPIANAGYKSFKTEILQNRGLKRSAMKLLPLREWLFCTPASVETLRLIDQDTAAGPGASLTTRALAQVRNQTQASYHIESDNLNVADQRCSKSVNVSQ